MRFVLYLLVFVALAAVILGYALWVHMSSSSTERFDDAPAMPRPPGESTSNKHKDDLGQSTYDARLYVLQTFDSVLRRKPTDAELDKYSRLGANSAIMDAIVRDFDRKGDAAASKDKEVRGTGDSDSESDSESESDDEEEVDGKKARRMRLAHEEVQPYAPSKVHKASEASPEHIGWSMGGKEDRVPISLAYEKTSDGTTVRVDKAASASASASAAPADKEKKKTREKEEDARICIDRSDLRARLQGIADQVDQFRRFLDSV